MTAAPVPLNLFHGHGSPADDPAVVQVWAEHFERIVDEERAENARTCSALHDAFVPVSLAVFTLETP